MSHHEEIALLTARVANLELALHAMWAVLKDLQPPGAQHDIDRMLAEHYAASSRLGGFIAHEFK